MPSIIPVYEYDIFISYRQNDNKRDGWVTEFVETLKDELEATVKDKLSIYFDENPHDGLLETHDVDDSLAKKLKCLIFIPIISKTYCDPNTFAWTNEFLAFNKLAEADGHGLKVALPNGNTANRVLPIKIHDISDADRQLVENEIGFLRSVDFVYQSAGVNRPLTPKDERGLNLHKTIYRDQINKVANAIQDIIAGLREAESPAVEAVSGDETQTPTIKKTQLTSELKRRNVLRASLVYILTALVFWKVADISIGLFNLAENMLQITTLVMVVLFPIAMIMAWLYERSPQGFIKTGSTASRENPFTDAQKKPLTSNTFILLLTVTIVALFLIYPQGRSQLDSDIGEIEKSIAVLPFENLSNKDDQEYFSEGITDVIISQLAKVGDFRVLSRTSTLKYKESKQTVSEIANSLNVNFIVAGSVQRQGDDLRINVQLIRANNENHLWAELYDRKWEDIFFIQSDVAQKIAKELQATLSTEEIDKISEHPTENLEAYNLFLQGRYFWNRRTPEGFKEAITLFEQSISMDSTFVQAYSGLAEAYLLSFLAPSVFDVKSSYEKAKVAIDRGLQLDPHSAEITADLAFYTMQYESDLLQAQKYFLESIALNPNYATARYWYSYCLAFMRDSDNALLQATKALELDPDAPIIRAFYATAMLRMDRIDEAIDFINKSLNDFPDFPNYYAFLGRANLLKANYDKAIEFYTKAIELGSTRFSHSLIAYAHVKKGNVEEGIAYLKTLEENGEISWVHSLAYFEAGDVNRAMESLEYAYENQIAELISINA